MTFQVFQGPYQPCLAGLSLRAITRSTFLRLSMIDFPCMLQVKLPVVDRIQPKSNMFAMGVENKATGDSKLNDSPALR